MGEFDLTLGVLYIGIIFNTYLYGVVTLQSLSYWRNPLNDRLSLRLLIAALVILDTILSISVIYMGWVYCIANYDNPSVLRVGLWPYFFTPIATGLEALITQAYLGYRVYRLLDNRYIYIFLLISSVVSFTLSVYIGTKAWVFQEIAKFALLRPHTIGWLTIQAGIDVLISGLLIYCLLRSRTGYSNTDHILNKLIRGSLQTGFIAAFFALLVLITFTKYTNTYIYGMFAIPIGRIYTITLLDTLLSRESLRWKLATTRKTPSDSSQGNRTRSDGRWKQGNSDLPISLEDRVHITDSPVPSQSDKPRNSSLDPDHKLLGTLQIKPYEALEDNRSILV